MTKNTDISKIKRALAQKLFIFSETTYVRVLNFKLLA